MKNKSQQNEINNGVAIYQSETGAIEFQADVKKETLWASLQQIASLFDTDKSGISRHIKNIYQTGELEKKSTVAKIATVQKEGNRTVKREIESYNLDVILSVGYRVNSKKATKFRRWATAILKEHIVKGYSINKERIASNYKLFLKALDDVKALLPESSKTDTVNILELVSIFADTWFSLKKRTYRQKRNRRFIRH